MEIAQKNQKYYLYYDIYCTLLPAQIHNKPPQNNVNTNF